MQDHESVPLSDFVLRDASDLEERSHQFFSMLQSRHSIRSFSSRPVPKEVIEHCIASAGTAPSGANHQPWHFVAINSPEVKKLVREKAEEEERAFYAGRAADDWLDALEPLGTDAEKPFLENAPWLIAIFAQRRGGIEEGVIKKNYYVNESVGIATGMLITAFHYAGLATLTHTPNPMSFLTEICDRPVSEKPYMLLVVGYPASDATIPTHALKKNPLSEILSVI